MSFRTKSRAVTKWGLKPTWYPDSRLLVTPAPLEREVIGGTERIEYTYDGSRKSFNSCVHETVYSGENIPIDRQAIWPDLNVGWENYDKLMSGMPPYEQNLYGSPYRYVTALPRTLVDFDTVSDIEGTVYDAYLDVVAGAPDKMMNFVRSGIELKDTRTTMTSLDGLFKWAAKAVRTKRIHPAMTCFQVAAAYLTYQWGVKPTIKDTRQFVEQLSKGQLDVHGSPRVIGKNTTVRVRYRRRAKMTDLLSMQPSYRPITEIRKDQWIGTNGVTAKYNTWMLPEAPVWAPTLTRVRATEAEGCLFARAKRNILFPDLDGISQKFRYRCPLAKVLWDVTPFTFLLDWIIDVGKSIERMGKLEVIGLYKVDFSTVWHSATRDTVIYSPIVRLRNYALNVRPLAMSGSNRMWGWDHQLYSDIEGFASDAPVRTFRREPYVAPSDALLPSFRWKLSAYQLSTGMALLVTLGRDLSRSFRR